jgi:TP901 family phage tail tape measure protein
MATNTEKIVVQVVVQGEKDLQRLEKRTGTATKSFGKMAAGVLGAVTAFRQVASVVSNAIRSFRDFEFQMAKVKAITGANRSEFLKLSKSAQDLGRSTFFTAQQVAELQTNYGKLGFTTQEILNAQEATLQLATATDSDLARAAIVAGSAVRGFGLDASETQRVVDVMAVAFTSSALDIEKFQTSMTKVAPIAKSAGFSIEDTTAIMSQLADSGIEASIAGTSLRNILLKMQDPNSDLVKSFGKTIHSLDELVPALTKFSKEGGSLAEIMEVVDLRQAAAFEQMITSRERTVQLRDALEDASGAAEEMARIVGDTLEGALKRSESATQGFAIAFMEHFGEGIKNIVDGFASFVNTLTDFIDIPVSEKLEEDRLAMNDLFNALQNTNISQDTRNKLVTELNMKYGEYLPNIVTEKTNLEDLKKAQVEANASMLQRVNILAAEERLVEIRSRIQEKQLEAAKLVTEQEKLERLEVKASIETLKQANQTRQGVNIAVSNSRVAIRDNTAAIRRNKEETAELEQEYKDFADIALELGVDIDVLSGSLELSTSGTDKNTESINANTQAKRDNFNIDKELTDFIMDKGVLSEEQQINARKTLNRLRQEEINLQLRDLQDFQFGTDTKKNLLQELVDLKNEDFSNDKKQKDDAFKDDVKRAIMSGQTAEQAMKTVVRAQIMEAVAGFIASIFKNVPFPVNLILAAGASAVVGNLIDGQLAKFADGGMVQGKSHAQGGEKFAVGGRVVELEGGEAVINKRSTAMFRNQLSAMNSAGGGVKFADGGLLNMPSFSQQQFNALGQNQMMGAMAGGSKVVVVEADITASQNAVSVIQSDATI